MANIAVFIPHSGCGHDCAFCDQRSITGETKAPSFVETEGIIEESLSTMKEIPRIAFFGGSFTGIGVELMQGYLSIAQKYVDEGRACGIRISTRPDYIDEKILDILGKYSVTNIELGAQSMDDEVLKRVNRGHDAEAVRRAAELINKRGYTLGLQMMTSLPGDTMETSLYTAREFVRLGAKETRIYPTVIIEGTKLAQMYREKSFVPDSLDEAVEKAAACWEVFFENNVKILRVGLQNSEKLKRAAIGGAYHDAMGELVKSRVVRRAAERADSAEIEAPRRLASVVLGQKRCNAEYFAEKNIPFKIKWDDNLTGVKICGKYILTI
ncbi:MAG: radical SAM protein [Clostridia bacterium]|nr:radical SAM protein [Clostridia bacterium]